MNDSEDERAIREDALCKIEQASAIVENDRHSYEGYETLLAALKTMDGMNDELQNTRASMSYSLLLSEKQWIEWIDDPFLPKELIVTLYQQAVKAVPSVTLWARYSHFLVDNYEESDEEEVISILSTGAAVTNYRFPDSHKVWNIYRDFMASIIESESRSVEVKAEGIQRLKRMYRERLATPHATLADTFSDFSTFITTNDNDNYEKEMIEANKIYAATLKDVQARDDWELKLSSNNSIENYAAYIQWELMRPKKLQNPKIVIALYERVILDYPREFAAIWDDYVVYLFSLGAEISSETICDVLSRATKAFPESGALWAHTLRLRNISGESFADLEVVNDEVKSIAAFKKSENYSNWKDFTMTWLFFIRKQFSETQDESYLERFILEADEAFSRTLEQGRSDTYFEMEKFLIEQWTILNDFDQARTIWNRVSKYHGKTGEFWIKWIIWERLHGDYFSTTDVFTKALTRNNIDWPERIFQEFIEYERSYGSFYSIQQCISKCRTKLKYYQNQRSQQYAQEQEQQDQSMGDSRDENTNKRIHDEPDELDERLVKIQKHGNTTSDIKTPLRDREHNTVIASNLPNVSVDDLKMFFSNCGEIKDVIIDSTKRVATIEFGDREGALAALTRHLKKIPHTDNEIHIQSGQSTTVWVTNFPPSETEDSLRTLFSKYGKIISVRFPSLKFNTHRRFCYIQFSSGNEALDAVSNLNGHELHQEGQKPLSLVVKISDPSKKTERTGALYEDREVFVKGIDFKTVDEARMRDLFEPYGPIERIRLPLSKGNEKQGRLHDGYCFIVLGSAESAQKAVVALNGIQLETRTIHVSIAAKSGSKAVSRVVAEEKNDDKEALPGDINARTLVVTNLADTINDTQLSDVFSKYGALKKVVLRPENGSATVEYAQVQV